MKRFLEFLIVWEGNSFSSLKLPQRLLQRLVLFVGLALLVSSVAVFGWLMSRWRLSKMTRQLSQERMKAESLEAQVEDFQRRLSITSGSSPESSVGGNSEISDTASMTKTVFTLLPSLDADEVSSATVEFTDTMAEVFPARKEIQLQFEVLRKPPRQGSERFYWIALIHGPKGILSVPPAFASRSGDPLLFHRGMALDEVRTRRAVSHRFGIGEFLDTAQTEPLYVTIVVFDNKGSRLLKKRLEPVLRRVEGGDTPQGRTRDSVIEGG